MKTVNGKFLKYTGIIILFVFLSVAYGYRNYQPSQLKDNKAVKTSIAQVSQPTAKKMVPGAACCKSSFSRAKMLSGRNTHPNVAPARN
ncbi:MAG: hypothetical protein V4721_15610 [Bacteroidota bacterium]